MNILIIGVICTFFVVLFLLFLLKKWWWKILYKAQVDAIEEERLRLGQELHDGISNELLSLKFKMDTLHKKYSIYELEGLIEEIDGIRANARSVSHQLTSAQYEEGKSINTSVTHLLTDLTQAHPQVNFYFSYYPLNEQLVFSGSKQTHIYRTLQESLMNALKHGEANNITINFTRHDYALTIMVEDDGKGFNVDQATKGIGLKNINKRIIHLQGTLQIDSSIGHGTTTIIEIPLKRNEIIRL